MNYDGPGVYRHYKGGEYEVLGLALQEDTVTKPGQTRDLRVGPDEVTFVVYRPLTPGSILEERDETFWARELADFNEWVDGTEVEIGGPEREPRFVKDSS